MISNVDPDTGIAYGYVAANDLCSDLVAQLLFGQGVTDYTDHSYQEARRQAEAEARSAWEDECEEASLEHQEHAPPGAVHPTFDDFEFDEDAFNDSYEADEVSVSGLLDGVSYHSSWLGGALNFVIFRSPLIATTAHRASPCVPNAGILKHPSEREGDVMCYDVPPDWWHAPNTWTPGGT